MAIMHTPNPVIPPKITEEQARKNIKSMNLINGFLFDSVLENDDDAKIVVGSILSTVLNKKIDIQSVTSQKTFQAIDTPFHGIRLDAYVTPVDDGEKLVATIYDIEMEDRMPDKKELPRRLRYYGALHDDKCLKASHDYRDLPNFITITILSYDPFGAGDMYYEASTTLKQHPEIEYDDGITHIFLYCNGKPNIANASHSKKLTEMLKYIATGEMSNTPDPSIDDINRIVTQVKAKPEVTTNYMKQWLREQFLKEEITEQVTQEVTQQVTEQVTKQVTQQVTKQVTQQVTQQVTKQVTQQVTKQTKDEDAIKFIIFCQTRSTISDADIKAELTTNYGYNDEEIASLYDQASKTKCKK